MIHIAVAGATGRMGGAIAQSVLTKANKFRLTAAVQRTGGDKVGLDLGTALGVSELGVKITEEVRHAQFDVLIDFTLPVPSLENVAACAALGKAVVTGTTGYNDQQVDELRRHAEKIPIVFAPNMSVGVNLLFHLLSQAASVVGQQADIEINETHHRNKLDAPSGTALKMGEVIAEALGRDLAQCAVFDRSQAASARDQASIGFSSIRAGDVVGDHTALFALDGERIEITHKASNRGIYVAGALRAAQWIEGRAPGLYDMQDVLGLKA